jgi:hypothetical protein
MLRRRTFTSFMDRRAAEPAWLDGQPALDAHAGAF